VRGYDPQQHFEERQIDMMDRFAQFAVIARARRWLIRVSRSFLSFPEKLQW